MTKPTITKGPAYHYSATDEAIYEFSIGGKGGLISVRTNQTGQPIIEIYNVDPEVDIRVPKTPAQPVTDQTRNLTTLVAAIPDGDDDTELGGAVSESGDTILVDVPGPTAAVDGASTTYYLTIREIA